MKRAVPRDGVGQLTFTIFLEENDGAGDAKAQDASLCAAPEDVREASRTSAARSDKPPKKRKHHSLIDKVYSPSNLLRAWARVRENQGAAGVDGITIRRFESKLGTRLSELSQDLRAKTYRPQPVRRVMIAKPDGGQRPLGIPTVRDRIVQQAILQILDPIYEETFSPRSHGFRKGRGCATALDVVDTAIRSGYGWVVDADISKFFDTVDQEKLLDALNEEIADGSLLKLIRHILTAGVWMPETATMEPTELGTPQGGPLSPLLANIYLHRFDVAMRAARHGLVRYADDFVIFARSEEEARTALEDARQILEGELGLKLHPEKTKVISVAAGFEFLGFHYFADPKTGRIRKEVRRKSVARFRDAVRRLTPREHSQCLPKERTITLERLAKNRRVQQMIEGLNALLTGWHAYFKGVWTYDNYFEGIDGFVRRRLRTAITGRTGNRGWWQQRLTNQMFRQLSLVSTYDLSGRGRHKRPWDVAARKG